MTLCLTLKASKDTSWNITHYLASHHVRRANVFKMWEKYQRLIQFRHLSTQSNQTPVNPKQSDTCQPKAIRHLSTQSNQTPVNPKQSETCQPKATRVGL